MPERPPTPDTVVPETRLWCPGDPPRDDPDRIGEILARLAAIEEKVDDIVARGKKTNSLVGMLVGRQKGKK